MRRIRTGDNKEAAVRQPIHTARLVGHVDFHATVTPVFGEGVDAVLVQVNHPQPAVVPSRRLGKSKTCGNGGDLARHAFAGLL